MATKAYFMIRIKEGLPNNRPIKEMIGELAAIPEVISVEPIDGSCDLLAQIEAPIRAVFAANKVMAKEWVKDLRMLKVEPLFTEVHEEAPVPKVLKKLGKHWVKDLHVLKVESLYMGAHQGNDVPKVMQEAGKEIERREAIRSATNALRTLKSEPSPGNKSAPSSRVEEAELERIHIHKEPLDSPTPYRSSLVKEAERIIRRRH